MATFILVTGAKEAQKVRVLDQVLYIYYPVQFQNDKGRDGLALLDSESKVNTITLAYLAQLSFKVWETDVGTQKIDKSSLTTYGMVITAFQIFNKFNCSWFF